MPTVVCCSRTISQPAAPISTTTACPVSCRYHWCVSLHVPAGYGEHKMYSVVPWPDSSLGARVLQRHRHTAAAASRTVCTVGRTVVGHFARTANADAHRLHAEASDRPPPPAAAEAVPASAQHAWATAERAAEADLASACTTRAAPGPAPWGESGRAQRCRRVLTDRPIVCIAWCLRRRNRRGGWGRVVNRGAVAVVTLVVIGLDSVQHAASAGARGTQGLVVVYGNALTGVCEAHVDALALAHARLAVGQGAVCTRRESLGVPASWVP